MVGLVDTLRKGSVLSLQATAPVVACGLARLQDEPDRPFDGVGGESIDRSPTVMIPAHRASLFGA